MPARASLLTAGCTNSSAGGDRPRPIAPDCEAINVKYGGVSFGRGIDVGDGVGFDGAGARSGVRPGQEEFCLVTHRWPLAGGSICGPHHRTSERIASPRPLRLDLTAPHTHFSAFRMRCAPNGRHRHVCRSRGHSPTSPTTRLHKPAPLMWLTWRRPNQRVERQRLSALR